jgi:hypothetical protein
MVGSLGAESEQWRIVLVVVEHDGCLVLVAEPTRQAVPCPKCGELSRRRQRRLDELSDNFGSRRLAVRLINLQTQRPLAACQHARSHNNSDSLSTRSGAVPSMTT